MEIEGYRYEGADIIWPNNCQSGIRQDHKREEDPDWSGAYYMQATENIGRRFNHRCFLIKFILTRANNYFIINVRKKCETKL